MAQKKHVILTEIKLGIFVTIALVLLAALILQQSWGIRWLSESVEAITYLPNVGGLKPGAPAWLAGIEIGKVRSVDIVPPEIFAGNQPIFRRIAEIKGQMDAITPDTPNASKILADLEQQNRNLKAGLRFVEVRLEIRSEYLNRISRDSEVSIESKGLIGDSFIEITPGTLGVLPVKRGEFYLIEGVATTGFREIMTGANDVIANFGVLSEQFKDIALRINPNQVGLGLAKTLEDIQSMMLEVRVTFATATGLVEDLRSGDGTFGKLVNDPSVYDRMAESLAKLNRITEEIQTGDGTLAKLIQDPALYGHASETLRKAELIMDRIEKGEGTLGRLSQDTALYEKSREAIEKFASFVNKIDAGDGTMGKLLRDPGLYNNLNQSTAEIAKLIYDLRKDPKKYMTIQFRLF